MPLALILDRAQSLIQTLDNYSGTKAKAVVLGDYRMLDLGFERWISLTEGDSTHERLVQLPLHHWAIEMAVVTKATYDSEDFARIVEDKDDLQELFDNYPTLNGLHDTNYDVYRAILARDGGPFYFPPSTQLKGSKWLIQKLILTVDEVTALTGGEYA